jgi:replicative DNA helicase
MIKEIIEEIEIGKLFEKLNIKKQGEYEAPSSLEINTSFGWKKIERLLKTQENPEWEIETEKGLKSCFADYHRLETLNGEFDPKNKCFWSFVKDLKIGDLINTKNGWDTVKKVKFNGKYSQMYDMQVKDVACFYANGFNSHNTMLLGNFALNVFLEGKKVLVYTFETSTERLLMRYYSNLAQMSKKEIILDDEGAKEKLSATSSIAEGDLIVKEYNANTICSNDLMAHINDLWTYKKWKPDLIITDYLLIMRANDHTLSMENSYRYYKIVTEENRNICKTLGIPGLTACQINREGMSDRGGSKGMITAKDISESRGIFDTVDFFAIIMQTAKDKEKNKFYLGIDKNRNEKTGVRIEYNVDYEHMSIREGAIIY